MTLSTPTPRRSARVAYDATPNSVSSAIVKCKRTRSEVRMKRPCGIMTHRDMSDRSAEDEQRISCDQRRIRTVKSEAREIEQLYELLEYADLFTIKHLDKCERAVAICKDTFGFVSMQDLCETDCQNARKFFNVLELDEGSKWAKRVWEKLDEWTPLTHRAMNVGIAVAQPVGIWFSSLTKKIAADAAGGDN